MCVGCSIGRVQDQGLFPLHEKEGRVTSDDKPKVKQMAGQKPIAKFRAGSVSCALFENDIPVNGTTKTILKASIQRRYKDKNGDWQSSTSFSRNEVPLAIYCLEKAFEVMVSEQASNGDSNGEVEEEVVM